MARGGLKSAWMLPRASEQKKKPGVQTCPVSTSVRRGALPGFLGAGDCGACQHLALWNNESKQTIKSSSTGSVSDKGNEGRE